MKTTPSVPSGIAIGSVILVMIAGIPLVSIAMETRDVPGAVPLALLGLAINLGFAALLYFVLRTWVRVIVALRAVGGAVSGLFQAFSFRERAGEWTSDAAPVLVGAGLCAVLFVILLLPISSRPELALED